MGALAPHRVEFAARQVLMTPDRDRESVSKRAPFSATSRAISDVRDTAQCSGLPLGTGWRGS